MQMLSLRWSVCVLQHKITSKHPHAVTSAAAEAPDFSLPSFIADQCSNRTKIEDDVLRLTAVIGLSGHDL